MITQSELKLIMTYCNDDGGLKRKVKSGRFNIGDTVGNDCGRGYIETRIKRKKYYVHRLVWLYFNGYWPRHVDHVDGNRSNNKIENLRDVTQQENNKNIKKPKTNTSGSIGVNWHKAASKWMAQIKVNKKNIYLGLFKDKGDAITAREDAEVKYGFHANHGR